MPVCMACTDCGKNPEATCHLYCFKDEPWLCRKCTEKRVKKLYNKIKSAEKRVENVEANLWERVENWNELDNLRLKRIQELERALGPDVVKLNEAMMMTGREGERCRNCQYWFYGSQECRRHAPSIDREPSLPRWPITDSGYWCGDYHIRVQKLPEPEIARPEDYVGLTQGRRRRI